jgi:Fe-S cluster assembly protein SufD
MNVLAEKQSFYLPDFLELADRAAGSAPAWLQKVRRAAIEAFEEKGFPTTRLEDWKNTNVQPIASVPFRRATAPWSASRSAGDLLASSTARGQGAVVDVSLKERIARLPLAQLGCPLLVFVNGHFARSLSTLESLPKGVRGGSLAEALAEDGEGVGVHLTRYAADYREHALVALNTAFLEDGAYLEVARGVVLEKPVCVLHVSLPGALPTVSYPRNLVVLGRESQATFIEAYVSLENEAGSGPAYFTNAVSEVAVGEGSVLEYHRVQQECDSAFHFGRLVFHQQRSSSVVTHSTATGGALVREEVKAVLDGEGAEATLNGLYVVRGRQHIDNQTTLDHAQPHCSSREVYKGILDDESSAVFNGKIIVRKDAQKTDSKQSNKNLLLSAKAVIDTKPALEIYADDVKCTHGATIGQIDPEAVFYLRSRGIGRQEARELLTYAFANDLLKRIKYEPLRERLHDSVFARLARGRRAQEE